MTVLLEDIHAAATRIKGGIVHTRCDFSPGLSELTGSKIFCKLEYQQRTGSFKERGARNALMLLSRDEKKRGVVAASAGNHGLGLSFHGGLLGIPITVVMPKFAPLTKITKCRQLGATVLLHGGDIAEAREHAAELERDRGLAYINGYDAPSIIAGQGTMALEVLEQVPDLHAIIVPIGGGGLIAGIALVIKSLRPDVMIVGVEPRRAASYTAALEQGHPVRVDITPTLADGLAVPHVGGNAFAIARDRVDRVVTVRERMIALAVLRLIEVEKSVVEGAGATPLAALLADEVPELRGKNVVLPLCGGNIDTTMLGRIIERGLGADGRLARFDALISDRPGGLARFAALLAEEGASIKEIVHDRAFAGEDLTAVSVHCVVEVRGADQIPLLRDRLVSEGFAPEFRDLR